MAGSRRRGPRRGREARRQGLAQGLLRRLRNGIDEIQSYCGAQIFEAGRLDKQIIDRHFPARRGIGGIGVDVLAQRR